MFRALAVLAFIVLILPLAALAASLIMGALGVSGLLGFIVGFPVFVAILTASVLILAAINDRINYKDDYRETRHGTRTKNAH